MKPLIRRILKEQTDPSFTDKLFKAIKDVGKIGLKYNPISWLLRQVVGAKPTKARLIFPKKGWETIAVKILEEIGVVTGTYDTLEQANEVFKQMKNSGIVLEELLIGSHGSPGNLLSTAKGGEKYEEQVYDPQTQEWVKTGKIKESGKSYYYDVSFLENIKPVVNSSTKVYFTACKGADKLGILKEAADCLGCECYACMGDNFYSFRCQSSNWSCKANTGVPTLPGSLSQEEMAVMSGADYKNQEWYETAKDYEDYTTKYYTETGVCEQQPNVPFNWVSIG